MDILSHHITLFSSSSLKVRVLSVKGIQLNYSIATIFVKLFYSGFKILSRIVIEEALKKGNIFKIGEDVKICLCYTLHV